MRKALIDMKLTVGLSLLMLSAPIAAADDAPVCNPQSAGTVACFERKLCSCGLQRGGRMTGTTDGYRWDCGILRPACEQGGRESTLSPEALLYVPQDLIVDRREPGRRRLRDH